MSTRDEELARLLTEVRGCRLCEDNLPLGPRPVLRLSTTARVLIVGQAPGTKVHATGIPWNDPSGDRLRDWLRIDKETFYDESRIAIVPMGFCYPGKGERGDLPPRHECATTWRPRLDPFLRQVRLTLLIGQYAQAWYLGAKPKKSLTETVRAYRDYLPQYFPLPHPSPRNVMWMRKNPWFEAEVIPSLQVAFQQIIND